MADLCTSVEEEVVASDDQLITYYTNYVFVLRTEHRMAFCL